jgi:hypothetical protein
MGSTFNYVGHDQLNNFNHVIVINNISNSPTGLVHHHRQQTTNTGTLPQDILTPKRHLSSVVSTTDFAIRLIVDIVYLLHTESSYECQQLERALKSLCQTLYLTKLAILAYECTPLGQSLTETIRPEVEQCCGVLGEILDKINHYQENLKSTRISSLWRQVWASGRSVGELQSLRTKLSSHHDALNTFLMALNSYVCFIYLSCIATSLKHHNL